MMLFWLEGDVAQVHAAVADPELMQALDNLANSAARGEHALSGDRDYLSALAENPVVDEKIRVCLRATAQRLTQEGHRLRAVKKVRVRADIAAAERVGDGWRIPLSFLADASRLARPLLIAENLRDALFYLEAVSQHFRDEFPGFRVSFMPYNGGGDMTAEVLAHFQAEGSPIHVCVVDSDKTWVGDAVGQTASKCKTQCSAFGMAWFTSLFVLNARELENIIPEAMRGFLLAGMEQEIHDAHAEIRGLPSEIALHICLKKGDSFCRFYQRGTLAANRVEDDAIACVVCGKGESCGGLRGFGTSMLGRVVRAVRRGDLSMSPISEWPGQLVEAVLEIAHVGFADRPLRAA